MDLTAMLLQEHSKTQKLWIAAYIIESPSAFPILWELVKTGASPIPQRAAWVLDTVIDKKPAWLLDIYEEAVDLVQQPGHHDAVYRNLFRLMSAQPVPEEHQGILYDLCLKKVLDPNVAIAIRAHCLRIAGNIAAPIPELHEEVRIVIREILDWGSSGIHARCRQVLTQLNRKK